MQEITKNHIIKPPSIAPWYATLGLLVLTLLSILWFWGYQFFWALRIDGLYADIESLNRDIAIATKDRDIVVADIINSANIRPSIDLKNLVRSFRVAASEAKVRLQGFSVVNDVISSNLIATRESNGTDPVEIIIAMMRASVTKSGLILEPIYSLGWTSLERTTAVSFRILPTNTNTNAQ